MKKMQLIHEVLLMVIFLHFLFGVEKSQSQTSYFQTLQTPTTILSNSGGVNGNVGVGTSSPSAKLNVRSNNGITTTPIFEINPISPFQVCLGSIKHFVTIGSQAYGIHQTSFTGSVLNYLQDPLKVGRLKISDGMDNNSIIRLDAQVISLDFILDPCLPSCDPVTPLTINGSGIIVRNSLITDRFQLLTNPGRDKILTSDEFGNGTWQDPLTIVDQTWIRRDLSDDLYANCTHNVGIGTNMPIGKFQVEDGPRKTGFGSAYSSTLGYGTGYIGFNAARYLNGSSYSWLFNTDNAHNGGAVIYSSIFGDLYFAPVSTTDPGNSNQILTDDDLRSKIKMMIDESGKVGIGTLLPVDKFQVNNSNVKVGIGRADSKDLNYGTGYIGFNGVRLDDGVRTQWFFDTDGSHNGGGVIWSDIGGNIYFSSVGNSESPTSHQLLTDLEIRSNVQLRILSNGKVGIGLPNDQAMPGDHKLFVAGGISTEEVKVQLKELWSDYVFKEDYVLLPISDLNNYIKKNGHLPDIPSSEDVEKNGIDLGQMNSILVKKVEELTLYLIELKSEVSMLKSKVDKIGTE